MKASKRLRSKGSGGYRRRAQAVERATEPLRALCSSLALNAKPWWAVIGDHGEPVGVYPTRSLARGMAAIVGRTLVRPVELLEAHR